MARPSTLCILIYMFGVQGSRVATRHRTLKSPCFDECKKIDDLSRRAQCNEDCFGSSSMAALTTELTPCYADCEKHADSSDKSACRHWCDLRGGSSLAGLKTEQSGCFDECKKIDDLYR